MESGFFGSFEHSLDTKGRITLPARLRRGFDAVAYLSKHHDRCIALWATDEFNAELAAMSERQARGRDDRNFARMWAAGVMDVPIDQQGRLAIPQYLRDYARLDGAVLITGAINHVEIWNPQVYAEKVLPAEDDLADDLTEAEDNEPGDTV